MSRINVVDRDSASTEQRALFDAIQSRLGMVPNFLTHVGLNVLTNILGKASRVGIDFPTVELKIAS